MTLVVVQAAGLVTIQDLGRPGYMHDGLAPGGALVCAMLIAANRAAGNADDAAAIEVLGKLVVRAERDIATSRGLVRAGAELVVESEPLRVAYLAIRGGVDAPRVFGSRATQLSAGIGALVRTGDRISDTAREGRISDTPREGRISDTAREGRISDTAREGRISDTAREVRISDTAREVRISDTAREVRISDTVSDGRISETAREDRISDTTRDGRIPDTIGVVAGPDSAAVDARPIRVIAGPDLDAFVGGALDMLVAQPYRVLPTSDRVGTRLTGDKLPRVASYRDRSRPMIRGAIEVPADGQPIVLGPEHPTTGGYPIIGVVAHDDVDRVFAIRTGGVVRFHT